MAAANLYDSVWFCHCKRRFIAGDALCVSLEKLSLPVHAVMGFVKKIGAGRWPNGCGTLGNVDILVMWFLQGSCAPDLLRFRQTITPDKRRTKLCTFLTVPA